MSFVNIGPSFVSLHLNSDSEIGVKDGKSRLGRFVSSSMSKSVLSSCSLILSI